MNKLFFALALTLLAVSPAFVSAHETRMFEINGVPYEMVVGSLNEPVIVDDKTGVSVEIVRNGQFLAGAQDSLQVEMIAGDTSKIVNLSPVHGAEGQYKSNFIATVPTTLTYRVFGTLENTPFDVSWVCNPAGHPQSEEETDRKEISDGVYQTLKRGAFGCPQDKEAFGFPEPVKSSFALQESLVAETETPEKKDTMPYTLAVLALIVSVGAGVVAVKNGKRN